MIKLMKVCWKLKSDDISISMLLWYIVLYKASSIMYWQSDPIITFKGNMNLINIVFFTSMFVLSYVCLFVRLFVRFDWKFVRFEKLFVRFYDEFVRFISIVCLSLYFNSKHWIFWTDSTGFLEISVGYEIMNIVYFFLYL